jgi:hypothetical protein
MTHFVVAGLKVVPDDPSTSGPDGGAGNVGALTLSSVDLSVPFSGFTAEVRRDYNSKQAWSDGPLGYGWTLRGINIEIERYADQGVGEDDEAFITLPDGRNFWFANDAIPADLGSSWNLETNKWATEASTSSAPSVCGFTAPAARRATTAATASINPSTPTPSFPRSHRARPPATSRRATTAAGRSLPIRSAP